MQVYREYTLSIAYDLASSRHTSVRFFLFGVRFTVGHGRPICSCALCEFSVFLPWFYYMEQPMFSQVLTLKHIYELLFAARWSVATAHQKDARYFAG